VQFLFRNPFLRSMSKARTRRATPVRFAVGMRCAKPPAGGLPGDTVVIPVRPRGPTPKYRRRLRRCSATIHGKPHRVAAASLAFDMDEGMRVADTGTASRSPSTDSVLSRSSSRRNEWCADTGRGRVGQRGDKRSRCQSKK